MEEKQASIELTVEVGPENGQIVFHSLKEIEEWLQKERELWEWIRQPLRNVHNGSRIIQKQLGGLDSIQSRLEHAKKQPQGDQLQRSLNELAQEFQRIYVNEKTVLGSSPKCELLKQICDSTESERYAIAGTMLATFLEDNGSVNFNSIVGQRGMFRAFLYESAIKGNAKSENAALKKVKDAWQEYFNDTKKNLNSLKESFENFCGSEETKSTERVSQFTQFMEQSGKESEERGKAIDKKFEELENVYQEKLGLHSAVTYWGTKAVRHKNLAIGFAVATIVAFCIVGLFLYLTITKLKIEGTIANLTFTEVGLVALVATIGVWIIRILVRILLSNMHLFSDAKERETMMQTYLALINEGKMPEDEDRRLILQALFRPSSTGIVKDDASPPFMAEWVKRITGSD